MNSIGGSYLPLCLMGILAEDSKLSETISMFTLLRKQLCDTLWLLLILSSCASACGTAITNSLLLGVVVTVAFVDLSVGLGGRYFKFSVEGKPGEKVTPLLLGLNGIHSVMSFIGVILENKSFYQLV